MASGIGIGAWFMRGRIERHGRECQEGDGQACSSEELHDGTDEVTDPRLSKIIFLGPAGCSSTETLKVVLAAQPFSMEWLCSASVTACFFDMTFHGRFLLIFLQHMVLVLLGRLLHVGIS